MIKKEFLCCHLICLEPKVVRRPFYYSHFQYFCPEPFDEVSMSLGIKYLRSLTSVVALAFRISILKSSTYFQTTNAGLQISQASKNIREVLQVILWPV